MDELDDLEEGYDEDEADGGFGAWLATGDG